VNKDSRRASASLRDELVGVAPPWKIAEIATAPFRFRRRKRKLFRPKGGQTLQFHEMVAPAPAVDWRGSGRLLAPLDQGACNTCSAFALTAAMGDLTRLAGGGVPRHLSPSFVHICLGRKTCGQALDLNQAIAGAGSTAVPLVEPGEAFDEQACSSAHGVLRVATKYDLWTAQDGLEALQHGPVLAVMDLFQDFWEYYAGGIYRHVAGEWLSAHSVEIVGYDQPQGCWIIKNSRGPAWGEGGYARIRFGECGILAPGGHGAIQILV
jgi:hypothetical protein